MKFNFKCYSTSPGSSWSSAWSRSEQVISLSSSPSSVQTCDNISSCIKESIKWLIDSSPASVQQPDIPIDGGVTLSTTLFSILFPILSSSYKTIGNWTFFVKIIHMFWRKHSGFGNWNWSEPKTQLQHDTISLHTENHVKWELV